MARITSIAGQTLYTSTAALNSGQSLGDTVEGNGKKFVRVKAGASALVVGNVAQAPAINTNFDDMAVAVAAAIGATQVTVTLGGTAVTANQFRGGSVTFSTGEERKILGHAAQSTTTGNVILTLDAPLAVALTTSITATMRNIYNGVIQAPTTLTGAPVGIVVYAIPANYYGYVLVYGECGVLSDNSTGAVGSAISNSAATAGAVGVAVAGTGRAILGHVTRALSSGKFITAKINI
jgi:hypothetical protein